MSRTRYQRLRMRHNMKPATSHRTRHNVERLLLTSLALLLPLVLSMLQLKFSILIGSIDALFAEHFKVITFVKIKINLSRMLAKSSVINDPMAGSDQSQQQTAENHPVIRTLYDHADEITTLGILSGCL